MKNVGIVLDSSFNLTSEISEGLNIKIARLNIIIDGKAYQDGIDLSIKDIFKAVDNGSKVTTSQPSPDSFLSCYNEFIDEGIENVVCFTLSSGVSGTHQAANIAKDLVEKKANISVVDTKSGAMGGDLIIALFKDLLGNEKDLSTAIKKITEYAENMNTILTIDDLNYLFLSGRLSKTKALIGSLMKVKPVLALDKLGVINFSGKVRTTKKLFEYLINKITETINLKDKVQIHVGHINAIDKANNIKIKLENTFDNAKVFISNEISPVLSVHLGQGGIGLSWVKLNN